MNYCTVVMTTFRTLKNNRAEISVRSIGSLLGSDAGYPYELVLVDNTVNNRGLGPARNLGASLAGAGRYLAFADDDIDFRPGWLGACVALLEDLVVRSSDTKALATPIHADIRSHRKRELPPVDGYTRNWRAGSNCWVMSREAWMDVGLFVDPTMGVARDGMNYTDRQFRKGYAMFRTRKPLAFDMALKKHSY